MSKEEYEEIKSLLYTSNLSQYGKRKLIDYIEKQQKEIEELKKGIHTERELAEAQMTYEINEIWKQKIKDIINKYIKEIEEEKDYRYTLDCEDEQRRIRSIEKELLDE